MLHDALLSTWTVAWRGVGVVASAYSARVRYIALGSTPRTWQTVRRDLAADFVMAFGAETTRVPGLLAIAVGADGDNTRGESLGYVADLQLTPGPGR